MLARRRTVTCHLAEVNRAPVPRASSATGRHHRLHLSTRLATVTPTAQASSAHPRPIQELGEPAQGHPHGPLCWGHQGSCPRPAQPGSPRPRWPGRLTAHGQRWEEDQGVEHLWDACLPGMLGSPGCLPLEAAPEMGLFKSAPRRGRHLAQRCKCRPGRPQPMWEPWVESRLQLPAEVHPGRGRGAGSRLGPGLGFQPQLEPGAGLAAAGISGWESLCLFDFPINISQSAHPDVQRPPVPPHPRGPPGPLHPQQAPGAGAPAPRHFLLGQARPGSPWPSFTAAAMPCLRFRSRACAKPLAHRGTRASLPASRKSMGTPRTPAQSGLCSAGSGWGPPGQAGRGLGTSAPGACASLHRLGSGPVPGGRAPEISQLLALLYSPRHKHLQEEAPPPPRPPPRAGRGTPPCPSPPTRLGPGRQTLTHTDATSSSAKAPGPGWASQMASPPPHAGAQSLSSLPGILAGPAAVQMQSRCPGARGKS